MAPEGRRDAATLRGAGPGTRRALRVPAGHAPARADRARKRAPVGVDSDPGDEVVRFRSDLSLVFPRGDLRSFEPAIGDGVPHVTVNFMGVATPGSFGSLPLALRGGDPRAGARQEHRAARLPRPLQSPAGVAVLPRAGAPLPCAASSSAAATTLCERALRGADRAGDPGARAAALAARPGAARARAACWRGGRCRRSRSKRSSRASSRWRFTSSSSGPAATRWPRPTRRASGSRTRGSART